VITGVPDDEAVAVWNDLNICERFGWHYDYVQNMPASDYYRVLAYFDARNKLDHSILKGK